MQTFDVKTSQRNQLIDVTDLIAQVVSESGVISGLAVISIPHTTAAITINENADPDVCHDIILTLDELLPHLRKGYRHCEGNSDSHVKSSLVGPILTVIIENSRLLLGTWQGIYFCEFDGPRNRRMHVKICSD